MSRARATRVVIVGGGGAGNHAAFTLRTLDPNADISLFSAEAFPEYSPCVLPHYIAGTIDRSRVLLRSREHYHRQGIHVYWGEEVLSINAENKMVTSARRTVEYDRLIVATGSRPVAPLIPGKEKKGVFFLKTLRDADEISGYSWRKAVVVGSGPIGVEISAALREKKGRVVSLVELERQILPRVFDAQAAGLVQRHLENNGVTVFTDERALAIEEGRSAKRLVTTSQVIDCDLIVLVTGMKPLVDLAKLSGAAIGSLGGIRVNRLMQTTLPDVYACGDCIEVEDLLTHKPKLSLKWYDARLQATVAAHNCFGKYREYPGSYEVTNFALFGRQCVSMGCIEATLANNKLEVRERGRKNDYYRFLLVDGQIVGAQLIGEAKYGGSILSAMLKHDSLNMQDLNCRHLPALPLLRLLSYYRT